MRAALATNLGSSSTNRTQLFCLAAHTLNMLVCGKHEHEHEHDYEHELHGGIQGRPPQYSAAPDPRRRASTIHGHRIMTETTASHCTGVPSGQSVSPTRSRFISKLFIGGLPAATYSPTSRQWLFL